MFCHCVSRIRSASPAFRILIIMCIQWTPNIPTASDQMIVYLD